MSATPFVHRHRVRYHELDPHNHAYNSRYLIRDEEGTTAEVAVAYVNCDPQTGRSAPIPSVVRERLEARLDPA